MAQTLRYLSDPVGLMRACAASHGELFTLQLSGVGDLVLATSPAHVEALRSGVPHADANQVTLQGDWCTVAHAALRECLRAQDGLVRAAAERVVRGLRRAAPFPLLCALQDVTLPATLGVVLGAHEGPAAAPLAHALEELASAWLAGPLLAFHALRPGPHVERRWARVREASGRVAALLHAEVRRRRESPRGHDLLALLLDASRGAGGASRDRELGDELVTILLEAHETASTALAWVFESVLGCPAVLGRLRDELAGLAGGEGELERLPFLEAVVRESLRLRPLVAVSDLRLLDAPLRVSGYTLPAGTYVASCVPELERHAALHREPDAFRPERFLGASALRERRVPGRAPHPVAAACALHVVEVVLAAWLPRVRLELACSGVRARVRGRFLAPEAGLPVCYLGLA